MGIHDEEIVPSRHRVRTWALVLAAIFVLAAFTTHTYVHARGYKFLDTGVQIHRHLKMMEGHAGNPWQYRVLSAYLVEGLIRVLRAAGVSHPHVPAFIGFRFVQDVAIFLVAVLYFKKLGVSLPNAVLGIMVLAWGVSYSLYDSDLEFNTFFDLLFYLLAGLAIISNRSVWILPITALAALNRETSGLIPFMYLAVALVTAPKTSRKRAAFLAGLSLGVYLLVFFGLRIAYGDQTLLVPYGHSPGIPLLRYNVLRATTWWQLMATLGLVPFLALFGYRKWPVPLRVFFWVVAPAWFAIHLVAAVMAETRVLLVPQALVFIPGALILFQQSPAASPGGPMDASSGSAET